MFLMSDQLSDFNRIPDSTGKTLDDLYQAKHDLEKREDQIRDLANQSNMRFSELMKVNTDLKDKIEFLQSLATTLSLRNDELEKKNTLLEKQKAENNLLAADLKKNLEQVVLKEKSLEIQRDQLERQINEKTDDLIKSQKLAIIGELASRMAHDLRNPLSTIKNVVELMESKPRLRIEEKLVYYGKLHRAIDRISHQVDDVLEYGRSTQLNLEVVKVVDIINRAVLDCNFSKDVKINVEKTDVKINLDVQKMDAVFTNLLINSVQAMGDGGIINVRIVDDGANALIGLEDSGPGIEEKNMSKIFDPLFTTKQTGTGLGLSICKKIIEQHGGSITAKNNPTTFLIRLPKNF